MKLFDINQYDRFILLENLVDHGKQELFLAGMFDESEDDFKYNRLIAKSVLDLLKTFSSQGHSGFSASMIREIFIKLSNWENLTPISSNPEEWEDVSSYSDEPDGTIFQNKRNPVFFSSDGLKTWWNVDNKQVLESLSSFIFENQSSDSDVANFIQEIFREYNIRDNFTYRSDNFQFQEEKREWPVWENIIELDVTKTEKCLYILKFEKYQETCYFGARFTVDIKGVKDYDKSDPSYNIQTRLGVLLDSFKIDSIKIESPNINYFSVEPSSIIKEVVHRFLISVLKEEFDIINPKIIIV